jgi:hypothetical protein
MRQIREELSPFEEYVNNVRKETRKEVFKNVDAKIRSSFSRIDPTLARIINKTYETYKKLDLLVGAFDRPPNPITNHQKVEFEKFVIEQKKNSRRTQ